MLHSDNGLWAEIRLVSKIFPVLINGVLFGRVFLSKLLNLIFVFTWSIVVFRRFFLYAFWPNIVIFDFTNTVIIMIKIRSDPPPLNISLIRPLFNYLVYYHTSNQIWTPLPGPLKCVKMRYASPDFYEKLLYIQNSNLAYQNPFFSRIIFVF